MGDRTRRTRAPARKEKADTADSSPVRAGRGKENTTCRTLVPTGKRKDDSTGHTQTTQSGQAKGIGKAAAASRDTENGDQLPAGKRGKGRSRKAMNETPSQEPGKKREKAPGAAGRTQSPEPAVKGRGRVAAEEGDRTGRGKAVPSGTPSQEPRNQKTGGTLSPESPEPTAKGRERVAAARESQADSKKGGKERKKAAQSPEQAEGGKRTGRDTATLDRTLSLESGKQKGRTGAGSRDSACRARSLELATAPGDDTARPALERRLPSGTGRLGAVAETLRKRAEEIRCRAEKRVTPLVDVLVRMIREKDVFGTLESFSTSWQEELQISKEYEFDVMLKISVPRIEYDSCNEGDIFAVKFKRETNPNPLKAFLNESENLSSSIMLSNLRKIIKEIIVKQEMKVIVEKKKSGNPAIVLLIKECEPHVRVNIILALEVDQSWPSTTKDGLCITSWLGSKGRRDFRFKPVYLVPGPTIDTKETWCLSFPHIEKEMLNSHGNAKTCCESNGTKCCRKACLRLLQYLLQKLQQKPESNNKFSSYHAKTLFFHVCGSRPYDTDWKLNDLDNCFEKLVEDFVNCLHKRCLLHFFIPSVNLFGPKDINQRCLSFHSEIERERNNDFPVFIP